MSLYFKITISILACLIFTDLDLNAQTAKNPFDIPQRSKQSDTTKQSQDDQNILSVENKELEVDKDDEGKASEAISDNIQNNAKNQNPFEVDHVPIKRSFVIGKTTQIKEEIKNTEKSSGFLFWFLLFSLALLTIVVNLNSKTVTLLSRSIFNENMLKLFQREEYSKVSIHLLLLYLVFIINISAFLYSVTKYFFGMSGFLLFLGILAVSVLVFIIRHTSIRLFGSIFDVSKNSNLYSFSIMVFNLMLGVVLIPFNFYLVYGDSSLAKIIIYICLVIIGIFVFVRTIRGVFIISEYIGNRIFQIFIYLCAFEVAPLLILIKFIINNQYKVLL